jgi:L-ascorbate 6-phosphate lactonase
VIEVSEPYQKIMNAQLKKGEIAILWLGQAGFLIRDENGTTVVIDPYLSDCGERLKGFVRQSPKSITADELKPDLFITTHLHFDHFDYDAIPIIASQSESVFLGPESCCSKLLEFGLEPDRLVQLDLGKDMTYNNIKITAVFADHGSMSPDAIGILMNINGIILYFSGDTAYRPEKLIWLAENPPDISFLSINGKYGNLNASEGAHLAQEIKTKFAVPCHYGTFIEHGGDPLSFAAEMGVLAPECQVICMEQNELILYPQQRML